MDSHVDLNAHTNLIDRSLLQDSWTDILEHLPDAVFIVDGAGTVSYTHLDVYKRQTLRSEERRVGKECRSRWSPYH